MRAGAVVVLIAACGSSREPVRDVWLVLGQSNALGANNPAGLAVPLPYIDVPAQYYWGTASPTQTESWIPTSDSTPNGVGGHHGPEVTFVRGLVDGGKFPILLKYAVNGASLYTRWRPNANDLYPAMVAFAEPRLAQLSSPWRLRGLLWVGCEGDATNLTRATAIADGLEELVAAIENDLGTGSQLHVVLPRLSSEMDRDYLDEARASMVAFVDADSTRRAWVNTDDLTLRDEGGPGLSGNQHYNDPATRTIGERSAMAALSLTAP